MKQVIQKSTGKKLTVLGFDSEHNALVIKGWKKNELLLLEGATTLEGQVITAEMFQAPKTTDPTQTMKAEIMKINYLSKYNQSNSGDILSRKAQDIIADIQVKAGGRGLSHVADAPNEIIASIADSVVKFGRCSEKQAYRLAKYAIDNNISIN